MSERVPRKETDLKDDRKVISAPTLWQAYACSKHVKVTNFLPFATIEIELNGAVLPGQPVGLPEPNGALVPLPSALAGGEILRARQKTAVATSDWSNTIIVVKYQEHFPAGLPRPEINPAPVFECGARTGVSNLLVGANVWITANNTEVGRVDGCNDHQGINVTPDYGLNQDVLAQSSLCNDKSPLSALEKTKGYPYPLPVLGFDPVTNGQPQIRITNVANGARVHLKMNGANMGVSGCWGGSLLWAIPGGVPPGAFFEAVQTLCSSQPPSNPGTTTAQPCGSLPPPAVYPVQVGDTSVTILNYAWGATVKVYVNGVKVGENSGSVVTFPDPIKWNDVILVGQEIGNCKSDFLTKLTPACVAPPVGFNPTSLNLFPVGQREYDKSGAKGNVFYPAEEDGTDKPFNKKLAALKRSPIIFLVHGNHSELDPSYKGYDYFQVKLARMGFIAVSVDCNSVNGSFSGGGVANIEARVNLIIASIKLFQSFDASSGDIFSKKIDFTKVGLMGHSRGGDAVVMTPEMINLAGVNILGVLALAPTDARFQLLGTNVNPKKFEFMTILPAGDGDVWQNSGARFYDRCAPPKFKSQLYVHFANHNYFNRKWVTDDGMGPPRMMRFEHENILAVYGCAFFRNVLFGESSMMPFLTGHVLPAGARTDNVHLSIQLKKSTTVDNHEQSGGIGTNTMGMTTSQSSLSAKEFAFMQNSSASFNDSFFGSSTGMVIEYEKENAIFTSNLDPVQNLKNREVWIRAAEVFSGHPHSDTGFQLGLTDLSGSTVWVDSNAVGGIPDPYPHPNRFKTMLKTLRFKGSCFGTLNRRFNIEKIQAIKIRCNRPPRHPALAFDDLQII